jgi:hypothetical protein
MAGLTDAEIQADIVRIIEGAYERQHAERPTSAPHPQLADRP